MRNPYIQGRSQINQATKSTEVVEDSPLELEEFSSVISQIFIKDNWKLLSCHLGNLEVLGRNFRIFWAILEYFILSTLEFKEYIVE